MAAVNFFTYTIIPFFVTRSGATLLNLSNVTTIVWSMLGDILLYDGHFYPLCLLSFAIELTAVILFSMKKTERKESESEDHKDDVLLPER